MHKNSKVIKIMLTASMHIICERDCMVIDRQVSELKLINITETLGEHENLYMFSS